MDLSDLNALTTRILAGVNLSIADLYLLFFLGMFIFKQLYKDWTNWKYDQATRTAIATFVYFFGQGMVRVWGVPLTILIKHGLPTIQLENKYPIGLAGTLIAMVGAFCMVRMYSPAKWRFWGWVSQLIVSIIVSIITLQI